MSDAELFVARSRDALRAQIAGWRRDNIRIGLIPTMGALHEGHLTLARQAKAQGERAVVSIFVNPTQFGPNEDFSAYPRREAADLAKLATEGVGLVWLPDVAAMYPAGFASTISISGITDDLEGRIRPGHFDGVATVVAKLLLQVAPDSAYFGEKDYQQLQLIKRLVADLDIPVRIEGVPTVREADGLAMSSRNAYLSAEDRQKAAALPRILRAIAAADIADADATRRLLDDSAKQLLEAGFDSVDYLTIRDAETLTEVLLPDRPARVLVAARLGRTRLLDNLPIKPANQPA